MISLSSFFTSLVLILLIVNDETVSGIGITQLIGKKDAIGVILDQTSRVGKEEKVAMEMAIDDIHEETNQSFVLYIRDSQGDPVTAALTAIELANTQGVQVILGPQTWEETSLVAEIGSQAQIPILSFSESIPRWARKRWPYLLSASPNKDSQMKAIAAIVQSWEWHHVIVIHEDIESSSSSVIPCLSDAFQDINAQVTADFVALQPFPSLSLSEELTRLKDGQSRVFIVHLSTFELAIQLFETAKRMDMMEKDYAWIITDPFTSLLHIINASTISSMQGILGVKAYFPRIEPRDFHLQFRENFRKEYPTEDDRESGIFAFQAYDAARRVCQVLLMRNKRRQLLDQLLITGGAAHVYQIINVRGNNYTKLGFWSEGLGFSNFSGKTSTYIDSMELLEKVVWPGGSSVKPRGWSLPTVAKPLKIGVPTMASFKQYVNVSYEAGKYVFKGFSLDVFAATIDRLPYSLPYEFIPFNGTYDDLVKQVYLKRLDAVVGDVAIVEERFEYAEFTHPYTESGMVMVVPVHKVTPNRAFLVSKPYRIPLWFCIFCLTLFNGFILWVLDGNELEKLWKPEILDAGDSRWNHIGTFLCSAFTSLFSLHGEPQNNYSRVAMFVWLFVALVITQTYTANLASILTADNLQPTVTNFESLRTKSALVGFYREDFIKDFLVNVLHFNPNNVKYYNSPHDYARALNSREIEAGFLEAPFAKLFLAEHCNSFTTAGPSFRIGGFGFVLPHNSPLIPDMNQAILSMSEKGTLLELEEHMIASLECEEMKFDKEIASLNPSSFWVLFGFTCVTSISALAWTYHGSLCKILWKCKKP